jgi:hypothetical protein
MRRAVAVLAASACFSAACHRVGDQASAPSARPAAAASAAAAAPAGAGTVPHGDHNPHYGGLVLMNGDRHFEVVLGRDGAAQVYFSDAVRTELPAAIVSDVTVTVMRKTGPAETIALHIDDSGESWVGRGRPVDDPAATARVAYAEHGKPYFIDVPFPR